MKPTKPKLTKPWFVYIILCNDNSLYTGITLDLDARFIEHQSGKGAKYTRGRGVKKIIFTEKHRTRSEASIREAQIKKLPREEKVNLVKNL